MARALEMWSAAMSEHEGPSAYRKLLGATRRDLVSQLLLRRTGPFTFPSIVLGLVEDLPAWLPSTATRALRDLDLLRNELLDAMGDGVLLIPPYPEPAPLHGHAVRRPYKWVYTAMFNALGFPVTTAPLGFHSNGLPLGVQIVAAPGRDHLTMGVAIALERGFGGWQGPPEFGESD
jgi:fatty acid amide hydrolase 2